MPPNEIRFVADTRPPDTITTEPAPALNQSAPSLADTIYRPFVLVGLATFSLVVVSQANMEIDYVFAEDFQPIEPVWRAFGMCTDFTVIFNVQNVIFAMCVNPQTDAFRVIENSHNRGDRQFR